MKKTNFRSWILRVVKTSGDVERERGKSRKREAQAMTAILVHESVLPYLEPACNYIKLTCDGLISFSAWKLGLIKGLASFD